MDSLRQLLLNFQRSEMWLRIVVINVIVFVVITLLDSFYKMGTSLQEITPVQLYVIHKLQLPSNLNTFIFHQPWSLFTFMFWHSGLFHLIINMAIFYIFGRIFEEYLGSKRLFTVFIWGGISGGLLYITLFNWMPGYADMKNTALLSGASASVMAVLAGTATLLPNYQFRVFGEFPLRLIWVALFFTFLSLVSIAGRNAGGELSHIGGAIFGFLYIKALYGKFTFLTRFIYKFKDRKIYKPKKESIKVYEKGHTYIRPPFRHKPTQEEIDLILDKISASGYESLSQDEKEILFRYSAND